MNRSVDKRNSANVGGGAKAEELDKDPITAYR